jgi:hypothetical protein
MPQPWSPCSGLEQEDHRKESFILVCLSSMRLSPVGEGEFGNFERQIGVPTYGYLGQVLILNGTY